MATFPFKPGDLVCPKASDERGWRVDNAKTNEPRIRWVILSVKSQKGLSFMPFFQPLEVWVLTDSGERLKLVNWNYDSWEKVEL